MKIIRMIAVLFLLLLATAASAKETIKIGLMAPITGAWASEGQEMRQVVELMQADLNKSGLNGREIELYTEDDAGNPRMAVLAAKRLVARGVKAVIGTYGSSVTEATQNIFYEDKVIQIANGSTAVHLTEKGHKYFFRTCPRDDEQARVAVQTIRKLKARKVAILHDNTTYARGLADEIKNLLKGGKIVFYDALIPRQNDYKEILNKIRETKPDVVFFTGYYPEAGLLLSQARAMNWTVPFIGGDATNNPDLVKIAGKTAAAGFYFLSAPLPKDLPSKSARTMIDAFTNKFGHPPNSIYAVLAGDGFRAITSAIRERKTINPDKLAVYLRTKFKDADAMTGSIAFNAKGDRIGEVYRVYRINAGGQFILQK